MTSRQERYDLGPLADFMAEDILSTPGHQLIDEVVDDCGDPEALASAFDKAVHAELLNRSDNPAGLSIAPGQQRAGEAPSFSEPLLLGWRNILTVLGNVVFPNRLAMAAITTTCVVVFVVIVVMPLRHKATSVP